MRSATVALLGLALLAGACRKDGDPARERYLEARRAYGAIFARTLDESCPEEPACGAIVGALAAIPAEHPDAPEARKVLARIERARAAPGDDAVPGFLQGDDPRLPEPDEVPAFLRERTGAGAIDEAPAPGRDGAAASGTPAPEGTDPGEAPDRRAADDEEPPVVSLDGGDDPAPPDAPEDPAPQALAPDGGDDSGSVVIALDGDAADAEESTSIFVDGGDDAEPGAAGATAAPDPCEELRRQLAKRKDWLVRTAAERNTIAHVTDPADFAALLQHRTMARCAEHPDDPDCAPPPLEADVRALTVDLDSVTREPGELVAEGRNPDDLPHDPVVRDLENRLRRCEAQGAEPTE